MGVPTVSGNVVRSKEENMYRLAYDMFLTASRIEQLSESINTSLFGLKDEASGTVQKEPSSLYDLVESTMYALNRIERELNEVYARVKVSE